MLRVRAKREQVKTCKRLAPESQGQNLALTVSYRGTSFISNRPPIRNVIGS